MESPQAVHTEEQKLISEKSKLNFQFMQFEHKKPEKDKPVHTYS
jgi:hypothetical protein